MRSLYKLIGKIAAPCPDVDKWARWIATADRRVDLTAVGPMRVSTVFIGVDYRFEGSGDPLIFETMIFDHDTFEELDYCERASTWGEAETNHRNAIVHAEKRLSKKIL